MTREEAINILWMYDVNFEPHPAEEVMHAIDMAIEALRQPERKDAVSRQAAIDALMERFKRVPTTAIIAKDTIENLPSAQPEIVLCKDCKHWDGVDTCDVIDAPVWDNDFCSMAERRSHE